MGSQTSVLVLPFHIVNKELLIRGSFRYGPGTYQVAIIG